MLETAIRLRIFDLLADGPKTAEASSVGAGASIRGTRILLNALAGLGFLAKKADRYSLTPESAAFLVSDKPTFLGGMLRHTSTQLLPKWLKLTEIVRTGTPAAAVNEETTGAAFFHDFVEDLFPFNFAAASALADALGVARARKPISVLDLAAGSGVWGIALAKKSLKAHVTAVDWGGVIPVTRRVAERHVVADRFRFEEGDLLTADFGHNHQIATLGHILHSEGADRSRALLKKTFSALAPGGTIAIAEWLVADDRTGPPPGLIFAVNMLVNTRHGDTFSLAEIGGWLEQAGFKRIRTLEVSSPSPLILADRPQSQA